MGIRKQVIRNWRTKRVQIALCISLAASGAVQLRAQSTSGTTVEKGTMTTGNKFYCNTKALNSAERSRHKELTDKLIAMRKEIVETDRGYEFQYTLSDVSVTELAEWVVAESKCCPFFDFHIDLEREGSLLCLRLTGEEGIKPFILAEFAVPKK